MKRNTLYILSILLLLASCRSSTPSYPYRELAHAGILLGMDIEMNDNHKLYVEASEWLGTPYKYGKHDKKGTDCSGLTRSIYKKVYRTNLPRSTSEQLEMCHKVKKANLKEGDLVCFYGKQSKRTPNHVGIYLKEGKFIHASLTRGVTVSSLNEKYYLQHWLAGGRISRTKE